MTKSKIEIHGLCNTCGVDLLGNLRERVHLEDTGVDGSMILKWVLVKYNAEVAVLVRLRIQIIWGLLWQR